MQRGMTMLDPDCGWWKKLTLWQWVYGVAGAVGVFVGWFLFVDVVGLLVWLALRPERGG